MVHQKQWFDSKEFEEKFHCEAPLGVSRTNDSTVFRLWAPTADAVTLQFYHDGSNGDAYASVSMTKQERGLWYYKADQDLDGVYYDFAVTAGGCCRKTADPYAKACGVNGTRSMVIDLRKTDPDGWRQDCAPEKQSETVIYELHVKDFSWDPSGGFDPADRGKYTALCRNGTTLNNDGVHVTGLDYLKRLGVTHIQLMPVYDFGSVDESGSPEQYNWGYDPANYNVPEGSYASDPYHGDVRIRELKQAITALHRNGFRVIMDVVYNHTYALESWLWRTVPWYYYRQNDNGSASNGSGCGNELATERSMCAKYILDSVLYWAEEYHIDGFRFDLMGLLDTDLMKKIRAALDQRYGAGEKMVYGEPWGAAGSALRPGTVLCAKDQIKQLPVTIGAFCDNTRDAVKGSVMDERGTGFVNGGFFSAEYLRECITGWCGKENSPFAAPSQTITYLSCHDDWTLWDKLVCTMREHRHFSALPADILQANRLAAAINFCCQGYPFFLAGEEFGRTKNGVKNSYCSITAINQLDWTRAWKNQSLADYYRGLIALRKQLPCLCDKSVDAHKRVKSVAEPAPGCGVIVLDNGPDEVWDQVCFMVNTSKETTALCIPAGTWQLLVNDRSSFKWQKRETVRNEVTLPGCSAVILGRSTEAKKS